MALLSLDEIAEAAVVSIDGGDDGQRLIGHVVLRPGERRTGWQVRRDVARLVPPAMVPGVVMITAFLPHGPGGKVDRTALPPPPVRAPTRAATPVERNVAEVFGDALGIDGVGPDDDFFALGVDSLDAVELIAALTDRFGVDATASMLLEAAPTPAELARRLGARRPAPCSVLVRLHTAGTSVPFVCVAGGGVPALSLRALATALNDGDDECSERPFYAIQARGLEERGVADRTVQAMARRNARTIRAELGSARSSSAGTRLVGRLASRRQCASPLPASTSAAGADRRAPRVGDPACRRGVWTQVTGARSTQAPSRRLSDQGARP